MKNRKHQDIYQEILFDNSWCVHTLSVSHIWSRWEHTMSNCEHAPHANTTICNWFYIEIKARYLVKIIEARAKISGNRGQGRHFRHTHTVYFKDTADRHNATIMHCLCLNPGIVWDTKHTVNTTICKLALQQRLFQVSAPRFHKHTPLSWSHLHAWLTVT